MSEQPESNNTEKMSEKKAVSKQKTTPTKTVDTTNVKNKVQTDSSKPTSGSMGKYLLFVVILITLVAVVYLGYEIKQQQALIEQTTTNLKKQSVDFTQAKHEFETTLNSINNAKQQELSQLRNKLVELGSLTLSIQTQLNLTQQQIKQKQGDINYDLMRSEADFLIRTAAIRMLLTQNSKHSIALLEAADLRLVKINDVAVFPVREALSKDLHLLRASEQVDVTGSYLQLEAIVGSIEKLNINFILPKVTLEKEKEKDESEKGWANHLSNSTESVLNKWFQVTHYDENIKPLISVEQSIYLKQSLQLMVKQAQWTLIQNKIELYQQILENLKQQLVKNFDNKDKTVISIVKEITSMVTESMVAPLPEILAVEKTMKSYLDATENTGSL